MKNMFSGKIMIVAAVMSLALTSASSVASTDIVTSKIAKTDTALDRLCYQAAEGPKVAFNAEAKRFGVDARKLRAENPTCREYGVRLSDVPKNYAKRQSS